VSFPNPPLRYSTFQSPHAFRKVRSGGMLAAARSRRGQLSVAEDALRASKSVEESLMDTLHRTIDGYEACVFFRPVTLVFD